MGINTRAVTTAKIESIEADGQNLTIHTSEPFGAFLFCMSEPLYSIIDVSDPADALHTLMLVLAIDAEKCSRN